MASMRDEASCDIQFSSCIEERSLNLLKHIQDASRWENPRIMRGRDGGPQDQGGLRVNRMASEMQAQAYELVMPVRSAKQSKSELKSAQSEPEKQMRKLA
jgi:hypothetical protein